MRIFAFLVVAALTVTGAHAAEFSTTLPFNIDLALPGFSEKPRPPLPRRITSAMPGAPAMVVPSKCYYIRQLNADLQQLAAEPQWVPLAADDGTTSAGNVNCLTRSLEPGPAAP
jgi:hypothetical protein